MVMMWRLVVVNWVATVVLVLVLPIPDLVSCEVVSGVRPAGGCGGGGGGGLKPAGTDLSIDMSEDILQAQYNFEKLIPEVQKLMLQYSRISNTQKYYCQPAMNDDGTSSSSYYKPPRRGSVVFGPTGIKLKPPSGPNPEGNFKVNDVSIETGGRVSESSGFPPGEVEDSPLKKTNGHHPIGKTTLYDDGLFATISSDSPTKKNSAADALERTPMPDAAATAGLEDSSRRRNVYDTIIIPVMSDKQHDLLATHDQNSLSIQQKLSPEAFEYPSLDLTPENVVASGVDVWPQLQVRRFRDIPLAPGQGRQFDRPAGEAGFNYIAADPVG